MGILEAVKKGFTEVNKLLMVVLVFFVFNVIIGMLSLPLANPDRAGDPLVITLSVVASIVFFLIFILLQGGALGSVKDQIKTNSFSISKFIEYGVGLYVKILGLLLLYILIAVVVILLLGLVSAGILLIGDNIATRVIVAAIVTVAALGMITLLVYPIYVIVVDGVGPIAALKKGISVAMSNFWKTLGLFTIMLLVSLVISFIVGALLGLFSAIVPEAIGSILIAVANAALQSYIAIIMMTAFMTMYMSLTSGGAAAPVEEAPSVGVE